MHDRTDSKPWHRQLWPWILIALPASAVIGCAITIWLVLQNPEYPIARDTNVAPVNEVLGKNSVVPPRE
jgi:hypothetical protein